MNPSDGSTSDPAGLPADVRVFVNERGISVPRGSTALDAVRAFGESEARAVASGTARIADSRGLPMTADSVLVGGTIMRVLPVRERAAEGTA